MNIYLFLLLTFFLAAAAALLGADYAIEHVSETLAQATQLR